LEEHEDINGEKNERESGNLFGALFVTAFENASGEVVTNEGNWDKRIVILTKEGLYGSRIAIFDT